MPCQIRAREFGRGMSRLRNNPRWVGFFRAAGHAALLSISSWHARCSGLITRDEVGGVRMNWRGADPCDDVVRDLLRGVGTDRRAGAGLHRSLPPVGVPDGASRRRARAARLARATADGHAHRSLRRPRHVHACCWSCRRWRRGCVSSDLELHVAAVVGILHRPRRIVVFDRRRVRVAVDTAGDPGHGARHFRPRPARPVAGGVRRRGRGGPRSDGRACFAASASRCLSGRSCSRVFARNAPNAARPAGVGAMLRVLREEPVAWWLGALLFPDLWRLRRVLDLPADAAARAIRAVAGGRRISAPRASSSSRR